MDSEPKYDQAKEKAVKCDRCDGRGWGLARFSDNFPTECGCCAGAGCVYESNGIWCDKYGRTIAPPKTNRE